VPHHWRRGRVTRPFGLNPTYMEMHDPHANAGIVWSSRPHRKHRYAYVYKHEGEQLKRPSYRLWGMNCDDLKNISWCDASDAVRRCCCSEALLPE